MAASGGNASRKTSVGLRDFNVAVREVRRSRPPCQARTAADHENPETGRSAAVGSSFRSIR